MNLGSPSFNTGVQSQRSALTALYETYKPNEPIEKSVESIAVSLNQDASPVRSTLKIMETLGLLSKEMGWHSGKGKQGRFSRYTLLVDKSEAFDKLNAYHTLMARAYSRRPQILKLLEDGTVFSGPKELSMALGLGNGSIDLHNMTHVLHAMKRAGQITFKTGTTKDKIPYNIRAVSTRIHTNGIAHTQQIPEVKPESTPAVIAAPEASESVTEHSVSNVAEEFPLIEKLIHKSQLLETLVKIAAEAEQEDIAIMVEDRMSITDFEREAINLYIAYENCKGR